MSGIDYNPDREGHVQHRFIVQNASKDNPVEAVELDGKSYPLDRNQTTWTFNEQRARAVQEKYGKRVAVSRLRHPHPADRGHRYFFTVPELPWKKQEKKADGSPIPT